MDEHEAATTARDVRFIRKIGMWESRIIVFDSFRKIISLLLEVDIDAVTPNGLFAFFTPIIRNIYVLFLLSLSLCDEISNMLIVLEGLDGAGKSTQVRKLRNYLQQKVNRLEYIHFPRYDSTVYGPLISRFLRGDFGSLDSVHPNLVALLFAEDRHGAAPSIREALDSGATVLLDRYVYSNIAYQCAKLHDEKEREDLRNWIFQTEYVDFGIPRPDLNIFLDVPTSFVESNLSHARKGQDRNYLQGASDIHEADVDFQKAVRQMYLSQCEMDPSFIRVDCSDADGCMLPPDAIFERIEKVVEASL